MFRKKLLSLCVLCICQRLFVLSMSRDDIFKWFRSWLHNVSIEHFYGNFKNLNVMQYTEL